MTDEAETRTPRLQHAHQGRQQPRVQRRDLLASGQGHTRQAVARLVGVRRHPVGHWRALDASGGRAAWRALEVPAGTPLALPADVLAARAQPLRQPAGVASDDALRQWVRPPPPRDVNDPPLATMVRTTGKATRQGPRPRPTHNPCRPSGVSGDLSGAAATPHPAGADPACAGVQASRK